MKLRTALPMPARKPVLVRAAGPRRDAVHVRPHVLVGRFRPLQHEVEPQPFVLRRSVNGASCTGFAPRSATIFEVVDDAFAVLEDRFLLRGFVLEARPSALVQIARDLEPLLDDRGVELDLRKDRRVGMEVDASCRCPRAGPSFFERRRPACPA